MTRYVLSCLVAVSVVLPHGAGPAHRHDSSDAEPCPHHDGAPHVHFGWLFQHDHDHDHAGVDDHEHPPAPCPADHNDDAVDLAGPMLGPVRNIDLTKFEAWVLSPAASSRIACLCQPDHDTPRPRPHPPPAGCTEDLPIYLSTSTLLL